MKNIKIYIITILILMPFIFLFSHNSYANSDTGICADCSVLNDAMDDAKSAFITEAHTINQKYLDNTNSMIALKLCLESLEKIFTGFSINGVLGMLPSLTDLLNAACHLVKNEVNNKINESITELTSTYSWSGVAGYASFRPGQHSYYNVSPPSANSIVNNIWGTIN